jgi:GrpB-like predicted nucleotidyltransferase (UPF0157 family)
VIDVVPYDPSWPERFTAERTLLEPLLAPWLEGGIHHIGSTAIPGIAAKPIIDMIAGVRDLGGARAASSPLGSVGYVDAPHRPDVAHHFAKPSREAAQFGLHLTEPGSALWRERLTFRDALRADPELAADYEQLKLRLARELDSTEAYTSAKRAFVRRVLAAHGIEINPRWAPACRARARQARGHQARGHQARGHQARGRQARAHPARARQTRAHPSRAGPRRVLPPAVPPRPLASSRASIVASLRRPARAHAWPPSVGAC